MDAWLKTLVASVDLTQLQVLALLCLGNMALGTLAALIKGNFQLPYLKEMWKRFFGVGLAYGVTAFVTVGLADFQPLLTAIWVGLIADLTAKLLLNLKDIGLPVPDSLAKLAGRAP